MGKHILTKIKDELHAMNISRDVGYIKSFIPWDENRGFSVECERMEEDTLDESGEVVVNTKGYPVEFSVYYQVGKKDVDACTLSLFLDQRDMDSLKEFVAMYRRV